MNTSLTETAGLIIVIITSHYRAVEERCCLQQPLILAFHERSTAAKNSTNPVNSDRQARSELNVCQFVVLSSTVFLLPKSTVKLFYGQYSSFLIQVSERHHDRSQWFYSDI